MSRAGWASLLLVAGLALYGCGATPTPIGAGSAHMGDPVTDRGFRFTVTDTHEANEVGSGFTASKAGEDKKYVIVDVTVRNISNGAKTWDSSGNFAYDGQGREFSTSSDAIMSGSGKDESSFLHDMNPGEKVDGRLVYRIPENVELEKVILVGSLFSEGAEVLLKEGREDQ